MSERDDSLTPDRGGVYFDVSKVPPATLSFVDSVTIYAARPRWQRALGWLVPSWRWGKVISHRKP